MYSTSDLDPGNNLHHGMAGPKGIAKTGFEVSNQIIKLHGGSTTQGPPPPPPHLYKCTSIYASFFFSRTGQIMLYLNHTPSHLINAPLMFGFSHVCPHILFSCTRTMTAFQHRGFIELLFIFTHLCQPPSDHE